MKSVIPWVLVVALLGGSYFLYAANQQKQAELDKLTQENQEVEKLRAENDELKKIPAQAEELARLRKDNQELLRLRADVQRLQDQAKQANGALAASQAQLTQAQISQQQQLSKLALENQSLKNQSQTAGGAAHDQLAACVNNLRQLEGAKQQWALEKNKTATDVPTAEEIAVYLPESGAKIICPAGGTYTINAVGTAPACSVAGHVLK